MEIIKSDIVFEYDIKGLEGIESDFFPHNFAGAIIGKPGSGKTTLLRKLLLDDKLLKNKYNYILLMSPSLLEYPFIIEKRFVIDIYNIEWIYNAIAAINQQRNKAYTNVLLIIDDFISEIKKNEFNQLQIKLFYTRRHVINNGCLSILLTAQRYIAIPTSIRCCLSIIIFFKIPAVDILKIWKEHSLISKQNFLMVACELDNNYKFMIMNIDSGKMYLEFHKVEFV